MEFIWLLLYLFIYFCLFWKRTEPNQPLTRCAHPCPPGDEAVDV